MKVAGSEYDSKEKYITLISITENNSTAVEGRLTIIDQDHPGELQRKLSSAFSSNSTLGNFTVISSMFKIINPPRDSISEEVMDEETIWGLVIASIFGGLSFIGLVLLGITYLRRYLREK